MAKGHMSGTESSAETTVSSRLSGSVTEGHDRTKPWGLAVLNHACMLGT